MLDEFTKRCNDAKMAKSVSDMVKSGKLQAAVVDSRNTV
jgi:hypothetical protein